MIALRNRGRAHARKTWAKVNPDNLDATYDPGALVLNVWALQREAARLSAGYLAAFVASETGEKPKLPLVIGAAAGETRTGSILAKAFRTPLIGVKLEIKDGKDVRQAVREGGKQLEKTVGLAIDDATREALRLASEQSPDVVGFQRAVKGTCEACMGLADGSTLPPGLRWTFTPTATAWLSRWSAVSPRRCLARPVPRYSRR